jgi:teichuronic acid biosynthesis glycosyltransferase TuaC
MHKKIVWTHSFRQKLNGSGVFMFEQLSYLKNIGINIEEITLFKIFNPIWFIFQYFKYKSINPDILHAQYGSGNGYLTSMFKAKKKVLTIRGSDWYFHKNQNLRGRIRSYISISLTKLSLSKYDNIIVMSNRIKDEILIINPKYNTKIFVITDGIDLLKFFPVDKNKAKQILNISTKSFLVGLGSIDPNNTIKNIPLAISTIHLTKKYIPEIDFIVITNLTQEFVSLHLSACDMILLTSEYEGWPNIIKEGLACNTPFVSTDVSDLHLITKKTNFCFIADSSTYSLSNRIIELFTKLKYEKPNNLTEIASEFSLNRTISHLIKIYETKNCNSGLW